MTDTTQVEQQLRQNLAELLARARTVEDDLRNPLDADSSEQAIDLADDEALAGIDDVLHREIHEVREALLRIESGTYGICARCGEAISPERLKALPTATRCIACA